MDKLISDLLEFAFFFGLFMMFWMLIVGKPSTFSEWFGAVVIYIASAMIHNLLFRSKL